jgi:hypothetical protein
MNANSPYHVTAFTKTRMTAQICSPILGFTGKEAENMLPKKSAALGFVKFVSAPARNAEIEEDFFVSIKSDGPAVCHMRNATYKRYKPPSTCSDKRRDGNAWKITWIPRTADAAHASDPVATPTEAASA